MLKIFKGYIKKHCYFVEKRNHSCWKSYILGNPSDAWFFLVIDGLRKRLEDTFIPSLSFQLIKTSLPVVVSASVWRHLSVF